MRSIRVKLTLAFLAVGLAGSLLVSIFVLFRTRTAFNQFILNREQQIVVANLLDYYQKKGSWDGLSTEWLPMLEPTLKFSNDPHDALRDWWRFSLVDTERRVVLGPFAGEVGAAVSTRELRNGIVLRMNGKAVGWLLPAQVRRDWIPTSPEGLFLQAINRVTLFSAMIAIALALTSGGLLAYTLTRPLSELTEATVQIARGKLGLQVKVRSKDELGKLAASFNKMSSDLARATQVRQQMTADVAHDLRSPLSVIGGYAEALSDGKLPGTPEVYQILHQETKHLSRLVDDLRTLSLADAGELTLTRQPSSPKALLERVAARHAMAADQQGITLRVQAPEDLPLITWDVERMAQVFDNLVLNAFRYTSQGGEVTLSAEAAGGATRMQVHDNGSGIAAEDLPFIFDRFFRGDKSRQQNGESGLGLAIARSIVEAHGGSIAVESEPGKGATFTITF